jgi:hypothetical protein
LALNAKSRDYNLTLRAHEHAKSHVTHTSAINEKVKAERVVSGIGPTLRVIAKLGKGPILVR